MLTSNVKNRKYDLKCDKGRLDRKNMLVRIGRDGDQNYVPSKCTVKCKKDRNSNESTFECHPVFNESNTIIGAKAVYSNSGYAAYQKLCSNI